LIVITIGVDVRYVTVEGTGMVSAGGMDAHWAKSMFEDDDKLNVAPSAYCVPDPSAFVFQPVKLIPARVY